MFYISGPRPSRCRNRCTIPNCVLRAVDIFFLRVISYTAGLIPLDISAMFAQYIYHTGEFCYQKNFFSNFYCPRPASYVGNSERS